MLTMLNVLTEVTNTTNFGGGVGHNPIDVHGLKLLRGTRRPPSPGIAAHAFDQSIPSLFLRPKLQPKAARFQPAVCNARRFIV